MGVDFIRKRVSDHRKKYAAMARFVSEDWVARQTTSPKRVYRATTEPNEHLAVGECVVLRRDSTGMLVVSKDSKVVATLTSASKHLARAIDSQAGVATATVHAVFKDSCAADLKVED